MNMGLRRLAFVRSNGSFPLAPALSQREREAPPLGQRTEVLPSAFGQKFSFRTRDEHIAIDDEFEPTKASCANDMLQRFTLATTPDHFTNAPQFLIRENAL